MTIREYCGKCKMRCDARKLVYGDSEQVKHKSGCVITVDS